MARAMNLGTRVKSSNWVEKQREENNIPTIKTPIMLLELFFISLLTLLAIAYLGCIGMYKYA